MDGFLNTVRSLELVVENAINKSFLLLFSKMQENTEPHLNVVFLDINRPNEELKFLERNSMWGHRIQFIHGSVLVIILLILNLLIRF